MPPHQAGSEELALVLCSLERMGSVDREGKARQPSLQTLIIGKLQVPPQSVFASLIIDDLICLSIALPSLSS